MSKFFKLIGLILLTVSFNGTSFSKENFFNEALELFKKEKYEDARFLFERNIVFNPKDASSYLYLAKIYNQEDNQRKEEYNSKSNIYGRGSELRDALIGFHFPVMMKTTQKKRP